MSSKPTPLYVTLGADEFVELTITELSGQDLTGAIISAQVTLPGARPTVWLPTTDVSTSGDGTVRVVRFLADDTVCPDAGVYDVWVRIEDSPETIIRKQAGQLHAA